MAIKDIANNIASNKKIILKRTLQVAGLAAGYIVTSAVINKLNASTETIIIEGDAVIEAPALTDI
jgi:hypothetical protein